KLKQTSSEAVYIASTAGQDAGFIVKQLRELNFDGKIFGGMPIISNEFFTIAGDSAEGVIATSAAFDSQAPDVQNFRNVYFARFGKEPEVASANAYDAVKILAEAIKNCKGDNTECIRDYLYPLKNYPGVGGNTSFDKNGDVIKPVILKIAKNGKFVVLKE
ncbi:MAG: ABC transporter substrate-binding protein, partial [Candidatus ainarchaeum sp.]|nr:ABC transporter substrate-binding protein [Candidatus ainarchaeum sp.]